MHRSKSKESFTHLEEPETTVIPPEVGEGSAILHHQTPDLNQPAPLPVWRLALITVAFWAVQFGW